MGPLHLFAVRSEARRLLRDKGYTRSQINSVIDNVDEDSVAMAAQISKTDLSAMPVGQLGDGTIIQAIIAFFQSPTGQALIAALVQMLIHLLGGL